MLSAIVVVVVDLLMGGSTWFRLVDFFVSLFGAKRRHSVFKHSLPLCGLDPTA